MIAYHYSIYMGMFSEPTFSTFSQIDYKKRFLGIFFLKITSIKTFDWKVLGMEASYSQKHGETDL